MVLFGANGGDSFVEHGDDTFTALGLRPMGCVGVGEGEKEVGVVLLSLIRCAIKATQPRPPRGRGLVGVEVSGNKGQTGERKLEGRTN